MPTSDTLDITPPVGAETACAHCGLPVGPTPVGSGLPFCCTGCAVVYEALHAAGFDETYYRLRDLAPGSGQRAQVSDAALRWAALDTPAFLDEQTSATDDGLRRVALFLDGVHCAACVWLVERLPFERIGVHAARLDLPRARLTLTFDPAQVQLSAVARWLSQFGYHAHPERPGGVQQRSDAEDRLLIRMGICWALAGNVMLLAFALYSGLDMGTDASLATGARWASLALATASMLVGGKLFFQRALASIRVAWRGRDGRRLHIDTPIALGLLVGYGHSAWATVQGTGEVWFDSITVLIAALLTARWLQLRSRRLAGDATDRLLDLLPAMARRVEADGERLLIRVDDLQAGDLIEVPAGEVMPVDGTVAGGTSQLNRAVLTGESLPEPVEPGQMVQAGATNLTAPLLVRVTAAGTETRVGRLLAWIRAQEGQQAEVVLLADRLSGFFVVAVLTLAAVTALLWSLLDPAAVVPNVVALLVISCPCALGMATPLAMAIATGRAARAGIFIKSDAATQQLTTADTLVFDKTGTLTEGTMALVAWEGEAAALAAAAALEAQSNHPIAAALAQHRNTGPRPGSVVGFEALTGCGVQGYVDDQWIQVGRPDWFRETLPDAFRATVRRYVCEGHTPVVVARDGVPAAVLAFGDRLRPEAPTLIQYLQENGYAVHLLSGDHPGVVQRVAAQLGLPVAHAHGGVSPEGKQAHVQAWQAAGRTVALVGDGVNDAAALQAADIGIAVAGGATPSLVAADVFLTQPGVRPVQTLLDGAARAMRVVHRNLGWALGYNLLGAGAAMMGLVTPLVAAVAMPVSSLVVVAASIGQHAFAQPLD